jgi:formylglycine-generating enzyme required for sulfatase activity
MAGSGALMEFPRPRMNFALPFVSSPIVRLRAAVAGRWWLAAALAWPALAAVVPATARGAPVAEVAAGPARRVIADLGLELIRVEPGTFVMGSAPEEPERNKAEGPRMQVTLSRAFWLGRTEVTQAQYEAVTGANPSRFVEDGKDRPVERVSWIDAMKFCRALTQRERAAGHLAAGESYTLPTEAQWEYACRAGTTGAYAAEPDATAWHAGNSGGTTHPVGLKRPNAWGFHDLPGNVLEWCLDWYGDYPGGTVTDPTGPERGHYRMARGGSWRTEARSGRSAARAGGSEGRVDYTIGFRLALVAER